MADAKRAIIKDVYNNPRTGFGSIADTLRQARLRDRNIKRSDVTSFLETVKQREDRPQRGYNSYVPVEPMHQVQVDLADMSVFSTAPYRYMLGAIDSFPKKTPAVPLASKTAKATAEAWKKVVQALGISHIYSDDGANGFVLAFEAFEGLRPL